MPGNFYRKYGKRIFDFCFALIASLICLPLFLIISVMIKLFDGSPVLFRQVRVGKEFKKFTMFKFRTMIANDDLNGPLVTAPQDPRVTRTGSWLRKYKLDELPQLINVLCGDIALVGPRPEMEKFVNVYRKEYSEVLSIYPGITDDATLKYKDEAKLLEEAEDVESEYLQNVLPGKIELYQKYIGEMSFRKDLTLILRTMREIFS